MADEAKRKRGEQRRDSAAPRRNNDYCEPDRASEAQRDLVRVQLLPSVLTKNTGHARNGQPVFCLFASFGFLYGEQGCERKRDQSDSPDDPHQSIGQSEIKER